MSNTAYFNTDVLSFRARRSESSRGNFTVPAGLKRAVKHGLAKVARAHSRAVISQELTEQEAADGVFEVRYEPCPPMNLRAASDFEGDPIGAEELDASYEGFCSSSLLEQASLPDWMLDLLAEEQGSAFGRLTMFEQRHTSRVQRFAASADDDGLAQYMD